MSYLEHPTLQKLYCFQYLIHILFRSSYKNLLSNLLCFRFLFFEFSFFFCFAVSFIAFVVQIYRHKRNDKTFCFISFKIVCLYHLLYAHLPMKGYVEKHFVKYFKNIFLYLPHESKEEITTANLSIRYDYN